MKNFILTLTAAFLCATSLHAAELGDAAKPLDIKEWIKGGPVDLAAGKGKNIYVIEFWATWCPPCVRSIPHLTELQKEFKDKGVVFVGVTAGEETEVVKKFVAKMGDKMDYVVAMDGGKTSENYMEAFGVRGIPNAFVVDRQGKIVWQGHPMAGLDKVLKEVVAGTYVPKKSATATATVAESKAKLATNVEKPKTDVEKKLQAYYRRVMVDDYDEDTQKLEAELIALDKELGGIVNGQKFDPAEIRRQIKSTQARQKYERFAMLGETNRLAALEKEIEAGADKAFDLKKFKAAIQMQFEMQNAKKIVASYRESVGENGDASKATGLARQVEALTIKDAMLFNDLAWDILAEDTVKTRDVKLALILARRAVDLSGAKEPSILDTYARALFDNGKTDEAIVQQKKAIQFAPDDIKEELTANLKKYEAKAGAK